MLDDAGAWLAGQRRANAAVTLLWPPREPDDFSLIVDGTAEVVAQTMHVRPTGAVLHRPAGTSPGA